MTPTLDEQIAGLRDLAETIDRDTIDWDDRQPILDLLSGAASTLQRHQQVVVALRYAISVIETEYRTDPTLQDLARSLRAALPENNDEKPK